MTRTTISLTLVLLGLLPGCHTNPAPVGAAETRERTTTPTPDTPSSATVETPPKPPDQAIPGCPGGRRTFVIDCMPEPVPEGETSQRAEQCRTTVAEAERLRRLGCEVVVKTTH